MKYLADDGKIFEKENDCREYEKSLKKKKNEEIREEMKELDLRIWKTFHPEDISTDEPDLVLAPIWLKSDICSILIDFENSKETILEMIHDSKYEKEILDKYLKWTDIEKNVEVRKDFATAFKNVKYGTDLSKILDYAFNKHDLKNLASLHKKNKCRRKIEELLSDCNFHHVLADFHNKNYDKYLNIKDGNEEHSECDNKQDLVQTYFQSKENIYDKVLDFAKRKHANQIRRSGEPVINHPIGVANILKEAGFSEKFQIIALLHDTLEDTDTTVDELFVLTKDNEIVNAVISLTKTNEMSLEESIENAKNNSFGKIIKGADRLQNAMTTYGDKNSQEFISGFLYKSIVYYLPALKEVNNPFLPALIQELKRLNNELIPVAEEWLIKELKKQNINLKEICG